MGWQTEKVERTEPAHRYDDEILSVNWNPVVELIAMACSLGEQESRGLREDSSKLDADTFLDRFYALAAQA